MEWAFSEADGVGFWELEAEGVGREALGLRSRGGWRAEEGGAVEDGPANGERTKENSEVR